MLKLQIRKIVIQIEETCLEMGREVSPPSRKVTVAAVITNPYAGQYVEDLSPLYALGAEIGGLLAQRGLRLSGSPRTTYKAMERAPSSAPPVNWSTPQH